MGSMEGEWDMLSSPFLSFFLFFLFSFFASKYSLSLSPSSTLFFSFFSFRRGKEHNPKSRGKNFGWISEFWTYQPKSGISAEMVENSNRILSRGWFSSTYGQTEIVQQIWPNQTKIDCYVYNPSLILYKYFSINVLFFFGKSLMMFIIHLKVIILEKSPTLSHSGKKKKANKYYYICY